MLMLGLRVTMYIDAFTFAGRTHDGTRICIKEILDGFPHRRVRMRDIGRGLTLALRAFTDTGSSIFRIEAAACRSAAPTRRRESACAIPPTEVIYGRSIGASDSLGTLWKLSRKDIVRGGT